MSRIIREAQPSEAVISAGMEPNGGFVIEDGGKIVGYFGFLPSPELTYAKIYEGEWINYLLRHHLSVVRRRKTGLSKNRMTNQSSDLQFASRSIFWNYMEWLTPRNA